MAKTRRQVQVALQALQPPPLPDSFIASIGDRTGAYDAGGNNIYVRELASGQVITVKNQVVPNIPGRLVKVERRGGTLYVVSYWGIYGDRDNDTGMIPPHDHRWPGNDFTPVESAAIMPFNILPYDGFEVQIFGGVFQKPDGTFGLLANQIFDLSGYQPATGAEIVHFQCDEDGVVSVVEGTEVDVKELLTVASIPAATEISLRIGVRLYSGQEEVRRDGQINDFYDWRLSGLAGAQGDMLKSIYDTDDDGVVDDAENAFAIDGVPVDMYVSPSGDGPTDGQIMIYDAYLDAFIPGNQTGSGGGGAFQRVLAADLTLADGECLVVTGYIDPGAYEVDCQGDAEVLVS